MTIRTRNFRLVVVGVFVVLALGWGTFSTLSPDNVGTDTVPVRSDDGSIDTVTLAEVEQHGTQDDCWLAIRGKVYDVTTFFTHPGGEAILEGCGTDATYLFENRPMGSGTPHSSIAEQALLNFYIGDLE